MTTRTTQGWHVPHSWMAMPAPIDISYRDEGRGKAPYYDHYTIQRATGRFTQICLPQDMIPTDFASYVQTETRALFLGTFQSQGKILPKVTEVTDQVGLLIIPGHAHKMETERADALARRNSYEQALLRDAYRRGRPILGICGGANQVWNVINVIVRFNRDLPDPSTQSPVFPPSIWTIPAKQHACETMPRIKVGGGIGYNVLMHRVRIPTTTMLSGVCTDGWIRYKKIRQSPQAVSTALPQIHPELSVPVNSVHWSAPSMATLPITEETLRAGKDPRHPLPGRLRNVIDINAFSVADAAIAPSNRTPEDGVIEGFELTTGAPILGIVWHPEAHNPDGSESSRVNRSLLRYMAQAGDAFAAKTRMLTAFKQQIVEVDELTLRLSKFHLSKRQ